MFQSEKAQTLLELVVVISVVVIVVSALTFATIASIRNASFAQNQLQATKLAQEGVEKVRTLRDRDTDGSMGTPYGKFSGLWSVQLGCQIEINNCYFYFNLGLLVSGTPVNFESIPPGDFKRQIRIEDYAGGTEQKKVTAIVVWTDFSGPHESRLTTILRRL